MLLMNYKFLKLRNISISERQPMENVQKLKHHNIDAYTERVRSGPCFICEMLAGKNPHHIVYQDDFAVAFMNKYTRRDFGYF